MSQNNPGAHLIPLDDAVKMNQRYRENKNSILAKGVDPDTLSICESFDRADFDTLLAQPDCQGLRFYFSMNEKMQVTLVAVGVNSNNEDMVDPTAAVNIVVDLGTKCPIDCPPPSVLNQ